MNRCQQIYGFPCERANCGMEEDEDKGPECGRRAPEDPGAYEALCERAGCEHEDRED